MLTAMLAGVEALAPALALEWAPVRVNAAPPGLMDTPRLHTAYGTGQDHPESGRHIFRQTCGHRG